MRKEYLTICAISLSALVAISTVSSFAQQQQPKQPGAPGAPPDRIVIEQRMQGPQGPEGPLPPMPPGDFLFMATEMSFGGKLVKGAPYSAQALTETVQTLSDGNRITNKSTANVYRDSEGRTRRDQTFNAIGPFGNGGGEPAQTIFINDPVANAAYTLDARTHVARKISPMQMKFEFKVPPPPGEGGAVGHPSEGETIQRIEVHPDGGIEKRSIEGSLAVGVVTARNKNVQTESLGRQNIEGVEADGTRSTITIPAGKIGNEKDIVIVSERWYSPELQTIVMSRHSDPRFGENTYRLTNINREEPARILFEVPSDYTIKEGFGPEPMRYKQSPQ